MNFIKVFVLIFVTAILSIPLGRYIAKILDSKRTIGEKFFSAIENFIYKICGIDRDEKMTWKKYASSLLLINIIMIIAAFIALRFQSGINSQNKMNSYLALNTAVSFMTNTDLQHYGETSMGNISLMLVIVVLMFTSAASGIAVSGAIIRGIVQKSDNIGNFYKDFIRIIIRVLIPLSFIVSIILVSQGVPQTLLEKLKYTNLSGNAGIIPRGPIAVLESIKHIGTNGGGFFTAGSAHPFENPTQFTNIIEMICMMLIPTALVYAYGIMSKHKKHAAVIYISLITIFMISCLGEMYFETNPGKLYGNLNINSSLGNMEGKEVRFGAGDSALFSTITTAFTTGSVNSNLDSYTPLAGGISLMLMMLNTVFGGAGTGLINIIMYAILTVFITGLMVGRTPEYLGNKIETKEVKLAAIAILIHPLLILFASALTLITRLGSASITGLGFHGLTQLLYEFTSASANNGSEFAGFAGNTNFMNTLTLIVMFIGRYIPIILLLAAAGSFASKTKLKPSTGTFRTDNMLFGVLFIATIIIVGALTFFPALVLGPVSEFLSTV